MGKGRGDRLPLSSLRRASRPGLLHPYPTGNAIPELKIVLGSRLMDQDGNGFALFFAGKLWLRVFSNDIPHPPHSNR
jgi:hypothetical protein